MDLLNIFKNYLMTQALVHGKTPILWGTVDMMALFSSELLLGPRPKVFLQVDWSNGGDGIVVRSARVQSANDLRGKTVVLCPFSPSHYYLLTVLRAAGLDPKDVKLRFTKTAYMAAKAFADDPSIDAVVSFSPDIYKLADARPQEMKLLSTTGDAKRLIADVFAVREDFAKAHPEVVNGLVQGILEGLEFTQKNPDEVAKLLFDGFSKFGIASVDDVKGMLKDAHLTNHAENLRFFADPKNPTSFARIYDDAVSLYKGYGALENALPASAVADPAPLQQPPLLERYKGQKDEYSQGPTLTAEAKAKLADRKVKGTVVTMIVYFDAAKETFDKTSEEVARALEEVAKLSGKFGGAAVLIEGYTDPVGAGLVDLEKRRNDNPQVPKVIAARAKRLEAFPKQRAEFVSRELSERYGLEPERFVVKGCGGAKPITQSPDERWKNRRVEVTIIPVEAE